MRALISTYDKTGLDRLGPWLHDQGVELLATGGTQSALEQLGLPVVPSETVTGFESLLGGRVKTLHPALHAAILARPEAEDLAALEATGIVPIDLVVVNLYPFRAAWQAGSEGRALMEQIDIGGVALLRGAAKNWERTAVLVEPAQYEQAMRTPLAQWSAADRRALAAWAFRLVAAYDADIANALSANTEWPERLTLTGERGQPLRYGENPHQRAAFYRTPGAAGLGDLRLLNGEALSYNNLLDLETAWRLASELPPPAAVAVKHQTPCGVALGKTALDAYVRARKADPVSIFGGIVAVNTPVERALAERLTKIFLEVVVAPGYSADALAVLAAKPRLRVVELPAAPPPDLEWRSVTGGFLVQDRDREQVPVDAFQRVAGPDLGDDVLPDLALAWTVVRYLKSNAVALVHRGVTVGVGAGQTNRIDAVRQAIERAQDGVRGAVLASDAFFFPDTVEALVAAGVRAAVSPGGSVRDPEVIAAAEAGGLALWFSGERHFRH